MFRTIPIRIFSQYISRSTSQIFLKRSIHCNLTRVLLSATDKDLPIPTQPTPLDKLYGHDTDILLEELKKAKSVERVLELISMHINVMNDMHIATSFNVIHDKIRDYPDLFLQGEKKLVNDEAFQLLCNRAMKRSRFFGPSEVIVVFKTLSTLQVRSNTYVMQAILKMLCSHLNDLSLNELTFLNFLLLKQTPNALVDSLKLALPLVLQIQLDQQLDSENLTEVINSLKMACKARLKPATIEKVIATLQTKVSSFTPEHAVNVIFSLFCVDSPVDGYMHLIKSAFDIVSNNIDTISSKTLLHITRACRKHGFYYRTFFLSLSKKAVSERWKLDECYELIGLLHQFDFFSPELLDFLSEKICANREDVQTNTKYSILTLAEHLTYADYQVRNVHNVIDAIYNREKVTGLQRSVPQLFFKLITCWAMMGYIREEWLSAILEENFLFSAWSLSRKHGRSIEFERYVCALQWSLENLDKSQDYPIPLNFMKRIIQSNEDQLSKSAEYPLTKFLENSLGGSQFFCSGVFTRNGHHVDHILGMRSGNYPVSFTNLPKGFKENQRICYIEDLHLPEDAKIIAIVVANKEQYCVDPCILKGLAALKIKNLSKMGYSPIVLNYENWTRLPDREKIPFIMKEIREVVQTDNVSKLNFPL